MPLMEASFPLQSSQTTFSFSYRWVEFLLWSLLLITLELSFLKDKMEGGLKLKAVFKLVRKICFWVTRPKGDPKNNRLDLAGLATVISAILGDNYKIEFVSKEALTSYCSQFLPQSGEINFDEFSEMFYQCIQNPKVCFAVSCLTPQVPFHKTQIKKWVEIVLDSS